MRTYSKLLIDESPLEFQPSLAVAIGVNEAIFLQQLHYWLRINQKVNKESHYKEGRWWSYNTYEAWQENNFPFWSVSTIKRIVRSLQTTSEDNPNPVVICKKFGSSFGAQTKWYSIDYEALEELSGQSELINSANSDDRSGQCDPSDQVNMTRRSGQCDPIIYIDPETNQRLHTEKEEEPTSQSAIAQEVNQQDARSLHSDNKQTQEYSQPENNLEGKCSAAPHEYRVGIVTYTQKPDSIDLSELWRRNPGMAKERVRYIASGHRYPELVAHGVGELWIGPKYKGFMEEAIAICQKRKRDMQQADDKGAAIRYIENLIKNEKWAALESLLDEAKGRKESVCLPAVVPSNSSTYMPPPSADSGVYAPAPANFLNLVRGGKAS